MSASPPSTPVGASRGASAARRRAARASDLYVALSAGLAAAVLGGSIFLLVRGYQWRSALDAIRAEPGIEVLAVERAGFFRKRLLGLRDPLAPTAGSILARHGIGPHAFESALTEYHSLNTPYALQREEAERLRYDELRTSMLRSVAEFAADLAARREEDLEIVTRLLFETRFPEIMESVELERAGEGLWSVSGRLYRPELEAFTAAAPDCLVEGELDFTGLVDLTLERTSSLRAEIESIDLLATDPDGRRVHLDRVKRLLADYDEVCARSDLEPPRLRLELSAAAPALHRTLLEDLREALAPPAADGGAPGVALHRLLPDDLLAGEDPPAVVLRMNPAP